MISKKMKYALKALMYIANHQNTEGAVKTQAIADQAKIPKKFLEQILMDLKKAGILNSKQGNVGGFYFVRKPEKVTLADVHRVMDGAIALLPCASKNFYEPCEDCPNVDDCSIRYALIDVRDETLKVLEQKNIAELAQGISLESANWMI
jgi:Rrf2 family protein